MKDFTRIHASVIYFTDYSKKALNERDFDQVKKCFELAEKLYLDGDMKEIINWVVYADEQRCDNTGLDKVHKGLKDANQFV